MYIKTASLVEQLEMIEFLEAIGIQRDNPSPEVWPETHYSYVTVYCDKFTGNKSGDSQIYFCWPNLPPNFFSARNLL